MFALCSPNWFSEQPQVRNHRCEILGGFSKPLKDMVARDGVEPPTPAFSGLCSTKSHSPLDTYPAHYFGKRMGRRMIFA